MSEETYSRAIKLSERHSNKEVHVEARRTEIILTFHINSVEFSIGLCYNTVVVLLCYSARRKIV